MTLSKKYNSIDLTKFIMSIFVVAIHIHPFENCDNQIILSIYNSLVALAVPFFFISSGFLVAAKCDAKLDNCDNIYIYI